MKFATVASCWVLAVAASATNPAWAEPTTDSPVTMGSLRPYAGGNTVYVYVTTPLCPLSFYSIDLSSPAGKALFAVAMTAVTTGRGVRLEIANAPCGTGPAGSTIIQSLYLAP